MQNKKKKICIFLPYHKYEGGAERVAVRIGDGLEKSGHEVHYVTLYPGDFQKENELCLNYTENLWSKTAGVITSAFRLKQYIKQNNIDVVISHLPRPNHSAAIAKILSDKKIKYIGVAHNSDHNGKLNIFAMKALWGSLGLVVCVSKGVEHSVRQLGVGNTTTIYNPFDFDSIIEKAKKNLQSSDQEIFERSKNDVILLQVARFVDQKNHMLGLRAFKKAIQKNGKLKLFLMGSGEHEEMLRQYVLRNNLSDNIFFLGVRENIFPLMKASDYVFLSSNHEGLPTVLVESLIVGTPCVSTDCHSGPREILFPNISLEDNIDFPKTNSNGVLVQDPRKNKVQSESNLSQVLSNLKKENKSVEFTHRDLFDEQEIIGTWNQLM